MSNIVIYPGSFDPITNGHIDLLDRATKIFDYIIIAVIAISPIKNCLFTVEERIDMIKLSIKNRPKIIIDAFSGLLVDYARQKKAKAILRCIRLVTDFEYEFQLSMMNRFLEPNIETIFLMPDIKWFFLSSSVVKDAIIHGGNIKKLVPKIVYHRLREKLLC